MEAFAHIIGVLLAIILMVGPVVWFLYVMHVLSFIIGCLGGIFEEITKKKGIF